MWEYSPVENKPLYLEKKLTQIICIYRNASFPEFSYKKGTLQIALLALFALFVE